MSSISRDALPCGTSRSPILRSLAYIARTPVLPTLLFDLTAMGVRSWLKSVRQHGIRIRRRRPKKTPRQTMTVPPEIEVQTRTTPAVEARIQAEAEVQTEAEMDKADRMDGAPTEEDNRTGTPTNPWILPPTPLPGPDNHPFFAALNLSPPIPAPPPTIPFAPPSSPAAITAAISSLDLTSPPAPTSPRPDEHPTCAQPTDTDTAPPSPPLPTLHPHSSSTTSTPPPSSSAKVPPEPSKTRVRQDSMTGTSGDKTLHGALWALQDTDAGWRRNQWVIDIG